MRGGAGLLAANGDEAADAADCVETELLANLRDGCPDMDEKMATRIGYTYVEESLQTLDIYGIWT